MAHPKHRLLSLARVIGLKPFLTQHQAGVSTKQWVPNAAS
jgi:hypothetical protein